MAIDEENQNNTIRFPAFEIDFENNVGLTGQDHEDYPAPGQARYDWMLMWLIGLLSHQSSKYKGTDGVIPSEARIGTIWYTIDLKSFLYTDDNGENWRSLSEAIQVNLDVDDEENNISLQQWYDSARQLLAKITPRLMWDGSTNAYNVTSIPIPDTYKDQIQIYKDIMRPVVYKNGFLLNPKNTRFSDCGNLVLLNDERLDKPDEFYVITEFFDSLSDNSVIAE